MLCLRRPIWAALVGMVAHPMSAPAADTQLPIPRIMPSGEAPGTVASPNPPAMALPENCDPPSAIGACPPLCKVHRPICGPRIRVIVPPAEVTYRKVCPPAVESANCGSECAGPPPSRDGFGAAPTRPTMTTIQVPYTYMVPVPTFAVMPQTNVGFGAAPVGGFGAVPQFGGIQPVSAANAGFGAAGNPQNEAMNEAMIRALLEAMKSQSKDGFGAAPASEDSCKKELAALNAKIEKLRTDLDAFRKEIAQNDVLLKEALIKLSEKIVIVNDKLGETKGNKTLAATIAELDAKLEKLKTDNNLK